MNTSLTLLYSRYGAVVIGFITALMILISIELAQNILLISAAIILVTTAVYLAKKTAHHFHVDHHHVGDSTIDAVAPIVLFLANILHPAVDGFSLFQTFTRSGVLAASIIGGGIVVHEILRQSALIAVFKNVGIKWYWILSTATIGIFCGIGIGIVESTVIENYEYIADLATVFAYSFVIAEYYYHNPGVIMQKRSLWAFVGILSALLLHFFLSGH